MTIEKQLYEEAVKFIQHRYPKGWGGAAAMYSKQGQIYISVAPEIINAGTALCIETGAILEAHKNEDVITHSICVVRDDEHSEFKILTPCGICQERLRYWGGDVKVAVTNPDSKLIYKPIKKLQPYHWSEAYDDLIDFS